MTNKDNDTLLIAGGLVVAAAIGVYFMTRPPAIEYTDDGTASEPTQGSVTEIGSSSSGFSVAGHYGSLIDSWLAKVPAAISGFSSSYSSGLDKYINYDQMPILPSAPSVQPIYGTGNQFTASGAVVVPELTVNPNDLSQWINYK